MRIVKICSFLIILLFSQNLFSQEQDRKVIQFAGVVFGKDSANIVAGAHIYIPKSGRGTTTNPYGFFSFPVLEGDSVIISAVGYKKNFYIIPEHKKESSLTVVITLQEDITFLEEVEILPFPTEASFKQAVVKMKLPEPKEYANIYQWMNQEYMQTAYTQLSASQMQNYNYFLQQNRMAYSNQFQMQQSNFLNPFAWIRFIKDLKRKKKRKR